ncbi:hypothetical protein [Polyangium aurulentum]|uniref:hypothetical protein n=1 Tax=Polyangium aurulentum TaxID=2567896 RepID=UPI0010AE3027|nr:hypothetical protein [Polyangium aurulentum]UQA60749.1 hypothetical protein E8A73_009815 [Polyangium aurulentum]
MASSRKKASTKPELPEDKSRYIKRSEALALVAQGGWTRDPENDMSYVRDAYVSDRGELLFLNVHGRSILHESRKAHMEHMEAFAKLPPPTHILEGLLPQGPHFIESVPALVDELAVHLKLPRESLDGSFESMHVVDAALKKIRPRRRVLEIPNFFACLVAYIGEVMRKESGGHWMLEEVAGGIYEPYIDIDLRRGLYLNPFLEPYKTIYEGRGGGLVGVVAGLLMAKGFGDKSG